MGGLGSKRILISSRLARSDLIPCRRCFLKPKLALRADPRQHGVFPSAARARLAQARHCKLLLRSGLRRTSLARGLRSRQKNCSDDECEHSREDASEKAEK